MLRTLATLLIFVCLATASAAADRPQGLLWNRSGLPATLPLQVKTDPGRDYVLHLHSTETGTAVLAAYIRGGDFFRVLVPPGEFTLHFAAGTDWQGETALFGPETRTFELDRPLRFRAGFRHKKGHLIDLRAEADYAARSIALCQRLALDLDTPRHQRTPQRTDRDLSPYAPTQLTGTTRAPEDRLPFPPSLYDPPRYDLRTRVCG